MVKALKSAGVAGRIDYKEKLVDKDILKSECGHLALLPSMLSGRHLLRCSAAWPAAERACSEAPVAELKVLLGSAP